MSHTKQILNYLLPPGRSIDSMKALKLFGCFRLSARIKNLRDEGHRINTEIVYNKKTHKHYAKYSLH